MKYTTIIELASILQLHENMRGFEKYTIFKKNIRDSKQIYDITYHLYQTEAIRLEPEIELLGNKKISIKTSVNSIEHDPISLHERLQTLYPFKLRQLILINAITALEVFLTDIILEIFKRDISPFKLNEPITFQRNYLINLSSIDNLKEEIVTKDFRNLTSGGLGQIVKYYKRNFDVDLKNIGVNFKDIEEIHTRRHLFIHRNGIADNSYVSKYPDFNFKPNQQIKITHEYILYALDKILEFASLTNKALLNKFPEINRKTVYYNGSKYFDKELKNLMLDISILNGNFDIIHFLNSARTSRIKLSDFIVKTVVSDNSCLLFISGKNGDLSPFFKLLNGNKFVKINKTIEL